MPHPDGAGAEMLSVHDTLGAFLYASPETVDVLGVDPEILIGNAAAENVPETDMATIGEAYEQAFVTMRPVRLRLRGADPDGETWLESTFQAIRHGDAVRLVALTRRVPPPADFRASYTLVDSE